MQHYYDSVKYLKLVEIMSHSLKLFYRQSQYLLNITAPVKCSANQYPLRILASGICYQNKPVNQPLNDKNRIKLSQIRNYVTPERSDPSETPEKAPPPKKLGLFQRFKEMYTNYWYVLVPVHMVTSGIWLGSFYYTVRSGVDIIPMLEAMGVSEKLMEPLKNSKAGYFALTFALYKVATPLRYAVTVGKLPFETRTNMATFRQNLSDWLPWEPTGLERLSEGGTTLAIKRLTALGWIKPVPSRERLKVMIQEKKDDMKDRFIESRAHYQTQMREQGTKMMDEMRRYKTEIRNMKNKVKKM